MARVTAKVDGAEVPAWAVRAGMLVVRTDYEVAVGKEHVLHLELKSRPREDAYPVTEEEMGEL